MKFEALYEIVITKWPNVIDISDGILIDNDGFYSKTLSNTWAQVKTLKQNDQWIELMIWSTYNVIHSHSLVIVKSGFFYIQPREIDIKEYKKQFIADLKIDGYQDMLSIFESNNLATL